VSRQELNDKRSRRLSERVMSQTAVDRHHRARDVTGHRRGEKNRETRKLLRLAIAADRDFARGEFLALLLGIIAPDLLAHDAPGRNRIDRYAVLADFARQALGPRMYCGLGRGRSIEAFGFGF